MATKQKTAQPWTEFQVATFAGQHDTKIETGEDYRCISLADIFSMEPQAKPKMSGNAFLPSTYHDYDARAHEVQRSRGSFVALVGDIDKANLPINHVQEATERFADGSAWLIYSSAHSREGDRRWRIVIPLAAPSPFLDWYDAQMAFFTFMEEAGCPMDHALSRAGQPVYLPNVPAEYKDGTKLRDDAGQPIYYDSISTNIEAPGLDIKRGIVAGGIASIRRQRLADDREREALREAAAKRHAQRQQGEGSNLIEQFNNSTSLENMLELCGYKQSPRSEEDWRSPQQTGDTYATRIIEGKWVSLSASDAGSGLGQKCRTGCFGDAYDLYVHYKHNGQHRDAYRAIGSEQRSNNVVQGNFGGDDTENRPSAPDIIDDRHEDVEQEQEVESPLVKATPFTWRPTKNIPKRRWVYGKHLLRKFVSVDVAAGGVGKSSLKIGEAMSIATGRDLYEKGLPEGALRVWVWNLEDPHEEIERRLHATAQRFKITPEEVSDRLFVDSGRDSPLVIAKAGPDGAMIVRPVVDALIEEMIARSIDVLMIDPFISSHAVSENDNNDIDIVAKEWNVIAERTGAAINLVHHVRKGNGAEATADSARGASALIGKARSVLVYNRMSEDEAAKLNVDPAERFFFFRVDNDKANLAPPERGDWYRMNNEDLENGDSVGVACKWTPPDAFVGVSVSHLKRFQKAVSEGKWRRDAQAKAWVGHALAPILDLDFNNRRDKVRARQIIERWLFEGALEVVVDMDEKRMEKEFVVVGKWVLD